MLTEHGSNGLVGDKSKVVMNNMDLSGTFVQPEIHTYQGSLHRIKSKLKTQPIIQIIAKSARIRKNIQTSDLMLESQHATICDLKLYY